MATAKGKKISAVSVADEVVGDELIPFAKNGDNGAMPASLLKGQKGDKGEQGVQGEKGDKGDDGVYLGLPIVEQTETTATINPDVLNKWGEVASLTIDFAAAKDGYVGEYCIEFVSGATPTTLSLPSEVVFPDEPTIEANMRYQISVVNNFGLIAGVAV